MAAQFAGDDLWDPSWTEGDGERTIRERSVGSGLTFYCSWFCPFAQRAWIALEEKQVPYRYVEINPYEVDPAKLGGYTKKQLPLVTKQALNPAFVRASPRGLVPASEMDGAELLCESMPLCEYVEERFPGHGSPLLPRAAEGAGDLLLVAHAHARAECRRWATEFHERVQRPFYLLLMAQDPSKTDAFRTELVLGCRAFSRAMSSEGPFFLGGAFSLVEVSAAPFWQRILSVGSHYRGLQLPSADTDKDFRRLRVWWEAVSRRPSVRRTLVCGDRLVASYADYAANQGTSDHARRAQACLSAGGSSASAVAPPAPRAVRHQPASTGFPILQPLQLFVKNGIRLVQRCTKPDRKGKL